MSGRVPRFGTSLVRRSIPGDSGPYESTSRQISGNAMFIRILMSRITNTSGSENDPVDLSLTGPEASVTENTLAETTETMETAGDPPDRRQIGAFTTSSGSAPGAGEGPRSGTAEINPYDRLPYPNYSHAESHPRKLEAIATLFGMKPPPSNACRVLELGCASGWNLIPLAQDLPFSRLPRPGLY